MALITCPECKKEISDQAEVCIHCGFPIKKHLEENHKNEIPQNTKYECILKDAGVKRKEVIELLIMNGYNKVYATRMCEEPPKQIKRDLNESEATALKEKFEALGAVVELTSYTVKVTIPCPGCAKEISKEAYDCPFCGHSIKKRPTEISYVGIFFAVVFAILVMSFL